MFKKINITGVVFVLLATLFISLGQASAQWQPIEGRNLAVGLGSAFHQLIADKTRARAYIVSNYEVIVINTITEAEIQRIVFPGAISSLIGGGSVKVVISNDGALLAAAGSSAIAIVDLELSQASIITPSATYGAQPLMMMSEIAFDLNNDLYILGYFGSQWTSAVFFVKRDRSRADIVFPETEGATSILATHGGSSLIVTDQMGSRLRRFALMGGGLMVQAAVNHFPGWNYVFPAPGGGQRLFVFNYQEGIKLISSHNLSIIRNLLNQGNSLPLIAGNDDATFYHLAPGVNPDPVIYQRSLAVTDPYDILRRFSLGTEGSAPGGQLAVDYLGEKLLYLSSSYGQPSVLIIYDTGLAPSCTNSAAPQLQALVRENGILSNELMNAHATNDSLLQEKTALEESLQTANSQISLLQQEVTDLNSEILRLNIELRRLKKQCFVVLPSTESRME